MMERVDDVSARTAHPIVKMASVLTLLAIKQLTGQQPERSRG
jgi:hypothetical protein